MFLRVLKATSDTCIAGKVKPDHGLIMMQFTRSQENRLSLLDAFAAASCPRSSVACGQVLHLRSAVIRPPNAFHFWNYRNNIRVKPCDRRDENWTAFIKDQNAKPSKAH